MKYREPLFRPPAEANSLIFQVAYGCPHNTCRFCGMYKGVRYKVRDLDEILLEIQEAGIKYPKTNRIFLADGDVMFLEFETIERILEELNKHFPNLARVNTYANGTSILEKSKQELQKLAKLKLNTLYMGLESGSDKILKLVHKQEVAADMIKAVNLAQKNGLKCSVMVLLGLGGRQLSYEHADFTAMVLNLMQPRLLSILRFVEVGNIKMYDGYETLSEYHVVQELRTIIEKLELKRTVFRSNHSSNPVPLSGRFPHDKYRLLCELDDLLINGNLSKTGPGKLPFSL